MALAGCRLGLYLCSREEGYSHAREIHLRAGGLSTPVCPGCPLPCVGEQLGHPEVAVAVAVGVPQEVPVVDTDHVRELVIVSRRDDFHCHPVFVHLSVVRQEDGSLAVVKREVAVVDRRLPEPS